jgi:WD40 repeat protein
VQISIMGLRKALGSAAIETTDAGYRLAVAGDDLDVARFEDLIERGRGLASRGEPERAASTLTRALALWRGDPYEDLDRWPPGRSEAARLGELRRSAQEDLLAARLAAGEHREVAAEAEARVAEEPLRERRWAILAMAQYRGGRQADALRSLHRARHTLADQLGIDPGPELVALEAAILRQDPALASATPEPPTLAADCPYKGLASYDIGDTEWFFGRDADVAACLERLHSVDLLVVAGPSGCGKSSLIRAGVVPALQRRGAQAVLFVPGTDPDSALTSALAGSAGHPVVIVDQAEELFTLQADAEVARSFCARLAAYSEAETGGKVIVVVRADHLASLAADAGLARLVEQGLFLVSPLAGNALRTAIEGPAAQAGLLLEPGLVDLLVRDTEGEPGALPLLSHALAETWRRRDGRVLTVEGYRATGGIRGAVARSADRLYDSLPADQRRVLRSVMLRLVAPADDGQPVRSRVASRTLTGDQARERVVGLLVRARLVTTEEDTVELAHEALARAWPRLRSWLDEDAAGQRILRHLAAAADGWDSLGRPDSELYRGARLDGTVEWRTATSPDLTATEAAFLDASLARRRAEEADLAAQAEAQRRSNRRLRGALGGVAAPARALPRRRRRRLHPATPGHRERAGGQPRRTRQQLGRPARQPARPRRPPCRGGPPPRPQCGHRIRPVRHHVERAGAGAHRAPRRAVGGDGLLLDDETMALTFTSGDIHLVDVGTGAERGRLSMGDDVGSVTWLSLTPDGRYLAAAWRGPFEHRPDVGSLLTVWDLETHIARFPNVEVPFTVGSVAINADGSLVAVSGDLGARAEVYDGATGALRTVIDRIPRPEGVTLLVNTVAVLFAPDGSLIVSSQAGPIRIVDPATGSEIRRLDGPRETSEYILRLGQDGRSLATVGHDGVMRYDLASGAALWARPGVGEPCDSFASIERLGVMLCGQESGRVLTLDLASGTVVDRRFDSQTGNVCGLMVDPAGTRLVVTTRSETSDYLVWRLDGSGAASRLTVGTNETHAVLGYAPGGEQLAAEFPVEPGGDPVTHVLRAATGEIVHRLPGVYAPVPTSDPNVVFAIFDDGTLGHYDLARHARMGPGIFPGFEPWGVYVSGDRVLVWDQDRMRGFDPDTGVGEPPLRLDHARELTVAVADADHLLIVECDATCVVQSRDPETGASRSSRPSTSP